MSEQVSIGYQRLFDVWLLHHYWLDDGGTLFDNVPDKKRTSRLLTYDVRQVFDVAPTTTTASVLNGNRCIFKATALGFTLAVPSNITLAADTVLEFALSVKGDGVFDYTSLTLRPQKIYDLFIPGDRATYRYKENVPRLSNLTGTKRGIAPNATLFLSQEIPAPSPNDPVEALVSSGTALLQLTSDNPGATTQQLVAQKDDFPVFVHQGDVPAIVPPPGLVGAPAKGIALTAGIPDNVFALIRLTAVRGDDDNFSFVDGAGVPKAQPPVYQVRFKNRSTIWTYLDKNTGAVNSASPNPLPLTFFGNAGTKQKPSRGHVKADKSGGRITRLVSEIYV